MADRSEIVEYALFSWGANSYGQLGVNNSEDSDLPVKVHCPRTVVDLKEVTQIAGGGGHTVLLTSGGQLITFGWNKNGQLGLCMKDAMVLAPVPVPMQYGKVKKVACGWNHTLALLEDGVILACGSNSFGQLGIPTIEKETDRFAILPHEGFSSDTVVDISAGLRHSVAVTDVGQLYSWGSGRKGQLGLGSKGLAGVRSPAHVDCAVKVALVRAGAYHSVAVAGDGSVLSWGLNQHGQCGHGELQESMVDRYGVDNFKCSPTGHVLNIYVPVVLEGVASLCDACCGWSHTMGRKYGRVLMWGRSDYGQLGREPIAPDGGSTPFDRVPTELPALQGVKQVECGSEHALALTDDGRVLSYGWNEHGQCGIGGELNVMQVTETVLTSPSGRGNPSTSGKHVHCVLIGVGAGHSLALMAFNVALHLLPRTSGT